MSYSGFHIGIVVENDDPMYGGRVKVYVPEFSPNLDKLNEWIRQGKEIKFNCIDGNMSPELVAILDDLKKSLPWAEYAGPIFGGSSDGRFRCATKTTSENDSTSFSENEAQNDWRPSNEYVGTTITDDFFDRGDRTIDLVNPNSSSYEASNYSGMVRGVFSVPNVGAQVYLFYLDDNPEYPVYFAAGYNPNSIRRIYTQTASADDAAGATRLYDYPGEFENSNSDTEASKVFRSKSVFNTNKHTMEFIDTDGFESIKLQHYGGAYKLYTNYGATEFIPGSDQKLVKGDGFLTIKGSHGESVGGNESKKVYGDSHEMVGQYDYVKDAADKIKGRLDELARTKRLFHVRRTKYEFPPGDVSDLQKREPIGTGFVSCPTCGGLLYDPYEVNGLNIGGTFINDQTASGKEAQQVYWATHVIRMDDSGNASGDSAFGFRKTRSKISDDIEYGWSRIPKAIYYCLGTYAEMPAYFSEDYIKGLDEKTAIARGSSALSAELIEKHEPHQGAGKIGVFGGIKCPTCNNQLWVHSPQTSAWSEGEALSGHSPSTENGKWVIETALNPIPYATKSIGEYSKVLTSFAKMNLGGDKVETVTMSKVETIGTVFNDLPSFRVDPVGKLRLDGLFVTQQSTVPYYLPTPHVEPVDVTSVPGGDYNLTVCNKWNVSVGSNGISIKTTGPLQIGGAISEISTQELNLSSKHDMMIDGGERLTLRARKITVNPVEHNALSIDGQLHVLRNMVVRGGALIEGEVAVQHMTAPGEIVLTGPETWLGGEGQRCFIAASLKLGLEEAIAGAEGEGGEGNQLGLGHDGKAKTHGSHGGFLGGTFVGAAIGAVTGGLIGAGIGAVAGGVIGGLGDHFYTKQKSKTENLKNQLEGLISLLSGPLEVTLGLPYHKHPFLQIPTTYEDCPNGVRASLLGPDNNINSRQIVVAAKRRHHVGALMECEDASNVYNKARNKLHFDNMIFDAICGTVAGFRENLIKKGFKRGENPNDPGNPMTYALLAYSGCSGNQATILFYTIRDYFAKAALTNPADIVFKPKVMHSEVAKLTFELVQINEDAGTGDDNFSAPDITNTIYTDEEIANGYVKNTEKAVMISSSVAAALITGNAGNNADLYNLWVGKFLLSAAAGG